MASGVIFMLLTQYFVLRSICSLTTCVFVFTFVSCYFCYFIHSFINQFVDTFSILSSGSKSDKLALAFDALDEDGDGCLNQAQLQTFLACFLRTLMALTRKGASLPSDEMDTIVRAAAEEATAAIFEETKTSDDGLIDFSQFGDWYTHGGFNAIAWYKTGYTCYVMLIVQAG